MEASTFILVAYILADLIAFVLSVVGNLVVCYAVLRDRKLSRASSRYILSVSIADFLVGLIVIPIGILRVSKLFIRQCFEFSQLIYLSLPTGDR